MLTVNAVNHIKVKSVCYSEPFMHIGLEGCGIFRKQKQGKILIIVW